MSKGLRSRGVGGEGGGDGDGGGGGDGMIEACKPGLDFKVSESRSRALSLEVLPRNLRIEVGLEKSSLDHQSTRFPLRLPRKVTTKSEHVHGTTRRAQSRRAPARPADSEPAVNSNEVAGSDQTPGLNTDCKNPWCCHTGWGTWMVVKHAPKQFWVELVHGNDF